MIDAKQKAKHTNQPPVIRFGWMAPPLAIQFPQLDNDVADHFEKDRQALIRLHIRGFLTDAQRDSTIKKLTSVITAAIAKAEG